MRSHQDLPACTYPWWRRAAEAFVRNVQHLGRFGFRPHRCRYSPSYNSGYRCHKVGWMFGHCTQHAAQRVRYERDWAYCWLRFSLDNGSRPFIHIDGDRPVEYVSVGIGVDGCDPLIEVGWNRKRTVRLDGDAHGVKAYDP